MRLHKYIRARLLGAFSLSVLMLMSWSHSEARIKVKERSVKKVPEWVGGSPTDYLIVTAYGTTLPEARRNAEQELLRKVVMAVGVNVESKTVADAGVEDGREWDNFFSHLALHAAKLPFLSDITLAKSESSYWERMVDDSNGSESYAFYMLYPFDSATRQELIGRYEEYDRRMESTLARLEKGSQDVGSLEDLVMGEGELETLSEWFPDAVRRRRAENVSEIYRGIRKSLVLSADITEKGKCRVKVMRGSRVFSVEGQLTAKSNCASRIKVSPDSDGWTVDFNTDDCLEYEDNTLRLTLRGSGINLRTTINF